MLYEPTNIIPSTMTQTGTVAATTDNVNIQWQVNGNSAMTMFQIDIMKNNADSTLVYSTGAVTENPTVAQGYSLPFYGKDRFGDYVQFVYQPNQTWSAWSRSAILDGNSYKFRITQFFQENGTACKLPITSNLSAGTTYYFSYSVNGTTQYVSFTVANASYFVGGNTIYFNFSHSAGWVATSDTNSRAITDITFSVSETQPSGTQLSGAGAVSSGDTFYNQFFTAQNSASSFITRTEPTLTITPLTEAPVASATQNFTATYSQVQGDSINTVRWQLFNADDMSAPIDDTGEISTSVLSYEYNGLFDGQSYSVICTVTTESGVSVSATLNFSVQYEQGTYTGDFTAQSLCHEDANLLKWDGLSAIPGVDNPGGSATISNGQLILPEDSTVTWSQKTNESGELQPMNFQSPWTAIWNGNILPTTFNLIQTVDPTNTLYATNNTGTLLCVAEYRGNTIFLYSLVDGGLTSLPSITLDYYGIESMSFNQDGTMLVVGGGTLNPARAKLYVYNVESSSVSFLIDISSYISFSGTIRAIAFSPDNSIFVAGLFNGAYSGGTYVFANDNGSVSYLFELEKDGSGFYYAVNDIAFSPDGEWLVVGGGSHTSFYPTYYGTDYVNIFRVAYGTNPTIEFTQTINLNAGAGISTPDALCYTVSFSPDGALLLLGGAFEGHAKAYSFDSDNTISPAQFVSDITINNQSLDVFDPEYTHVISVLSFNSEGTSLLVRFINSNSTILFSVNDTNVLYGATIQEGESTRVYRGGYIPNSTLYFMGNKLWEQNSPVIEEIFAVLGDSICVSQNGQKITVSRVVENNAKEAIGTTLIIENENVATNNIVIALMPTSLQVYSFLDGQYIGMQEISISYTQQRISSAQLQGKQTCNYFTIIDGDGSNIAENLTDYTWEPEWDNVNYIVDLLANFNYGIDGGTATQTGTGFRIYRRKSDGTENIELATLPSTTLSLRDYGIKSNECYIYDFYVYDANGAFMGVRSTEAMPLKRQFKRFSLLSTQYNESDKCYHVVKEYQFSCNIQDMTVSNNSNKSYVQNFTPFPTVFQSTANYSSGTLQALIGFVDPKSYKYWDSTQLMDELNALSTTTNTLFLKDMKGHLWMVDVGTVQMTATQKTREMQVTISLPWTEIGDASDVSIIQTPDDEGWDYGEQVLDVKLDVDVNTGLLYVTYPFPYNGTAFYLVGTNPVGSENIVQPLPETASSPQDGILKAKVRDK